MFCHVQALNIIIMVCGVGGTKAFQIMSCHVSLFDVMFCHVLDLKIIIMVGGVGGTKAFQIM